MNMFMHKAIHIQKYLQKSLKTISKPLIKFVVNIIWITFLTQQYLDYIYPKYHTMSYQLQHITFLFETTIIPSLPLMEKNTIKGLS